MALIVKTESCEAGQGDRLINDSQRAFQSLGDMRPDADDDRMTLEDMEDIPSMSITERDRESPAFITVENEKGVIEHVQVSHVQKSSASP